jgi:hypothetical protein
MRSEIPMAIAAGLNASRMKSLSANILTIAAIF